MYVEKETPVTGTGRGSQRYSTPSNELNIEDEKGTNAQATSGLSVMAMAEIKGLSDRSKNSQEMSGPNLKRLLLAQSRSILLSILSLIKAPKDRLALAFKEFMSKIGLMNSSLPVYGNNKSFEKICLELARVDGEEPALNAISENVFEISSLELIIKTLNSQKFVLMLPTSPDAKVAVEGAGDYEEQGAGGTCDQFIGMLPESCKKISEKASPLGLVPKLLPYGIISKEARYVGSCFWIWLCIVDDLTENLLGKAWKETEADLFLAFSKNPEVGEFHNKNSEAVKVSIALRNVIHSTNICSGMAGSASEDPWRMALISAICEVLTGFREERPLLSNKKISMYEWMRLRAITISVRPFLILARADMGLTPTVSHMGNPLDEDYQIFSNENDLTNMSALRKMECMLQLIMGLQNDILGWEKDFKTENKLSAIQVLIQHGAKHPNAMNRVICIHNELVRRCLCHAQLVWDDPSDLAVRYDWDGLPSYASLKNNVRSTSFNLLRQDAGRGYKVDKQKIRNYVGLILGFANGMATWMAVSKRYTA